jgi:hypothetical protein
VSATATKAPGRSKADPHIAEAQALQRIATLAVNVLRTLRQSGRYRYDSERVLRKRLSDDGIAYTISDLGSALTLLEAAGRLVRPLRRLILLIRGGSQKALRSSRTTQ